MAASRSTLSGPKGRPPLRPCPDDFEVIFVEQGRVGCEAWYRARRDTITRWLKEKGKDRLIKARAAYVAHQRANGQWLTRSSNLVEHRDVRSAGRSLPIRDKRKVDFTTARHAAQHLRVMRNGGYVVSPAPNGDWRVGSRLLSAAQMVDLAKEKGFEATSSREEPDAEPHRPMGKPIEAASAAFSRYKVDWAERLFAERNRADLKIGANWVDDDLPSALQDYGNGEVKR